MVFRDDLREAVKSTKAEEPGMFGRGSPTFRSQRKVFHDRQELIHAI
jgi:hypothetical protein